MEKTTEGNIVMSAAELTTLLEQQAQAASEKVIKAANLDKPETPPVIPRTDIHGGKLTVTDAPKHTRIIRYFKAQAEGDIATVKALTEGSGVDGGNLVPTEFAQDLLAAIEQYGVARRDCDVYPMMSNELDLRTVTTKPTIYQVGEHIAPNEAGTKFGKPILTAKAFAGVQVMSKELFQDNNVALYNKFVNLFGEQFAAREDQEVLNGTTFTGVLKSSANVITTADTSIANITYKELVKIKRSLSPGKLMGGGKWYMHRTILSYIEGLTDTNGRPIVVNPFGASESTLLGYPVELTEQMPDTDAANSPFIIFGNLKWVAFGDRQDIESQTLREGTVAGVNLAEQRSYAIMVDARWGVTVMIPANITIVKTKA
jgi:HK97 family phage major capsid protein